MVVGLKLQADGQVRRVRLRRQHRRADGRVDVRAQAARRPEAPGHRHDRSRRRASRSSCSTRAPTSTAPPTSSCSSPGSARSTPKTSSAAPNPAVGLLSIGEEPEKGNAVGQGGAPAARRRPASTSSATSKDATSRRRQRRAARSTSSSATASSATSCSSSTRRSRRIIIGLLAKAGVDQRTS